MVVGVISTLALIAAVVMSVPVWVLYPAGVLIIIAIIFRFGRVPDPKDYT
jgi:hypothetical protein